MPSSSLIRVGQQSFDFGAFKLSATGLTVKGRPSFDEWQQCGVVLRRIEGAVQFWIGDWVNYGERRWGDKYTQAVEATGLDQQTVRVYASVANNVDPLIRINKVSWSVHREVAQLPPAKQAALLERAEFESLTVRDVKELIRLNAHAEKVALIARGALPIGEYDLVVADPPWQYDNAGFTQSAAAHYPTMTADAIAHLPVTDPTFPKFADPCVAFLWATAPLCPAAVTVLATWGFDYKTCMVWVKDRAPGLGWWLETRHELLLIGVRGSAVPVERVDSVIEACVRDHSRKPDDAYAAIDTMFPGLRRVECFAREPRDGWARWGNEA